MLQASISLFYERYWCGIAEWTPMFRRRHLSILKKQMYKHLPLQHRVLPVAVTRYDFHYEMKLSEVFRHCLPIDLE